MRRRPSLGAPRSERGVTLLEILIVLSLLSIVMLVVAPSVVNNGIRGEIKAAELQLGTVSTALLAFRTEYRRFPTEAEGLDALVNPPPKKSGAVPPPFAKSNLLSDPWGTPIQYSVEGRSFELTSLGPDGELGGDGPDADITTEDG